MKRITIVNKCNVNHYKYYLDDIDRPFITVSHFTTSDHDTEIEDFKIFFDHIEFARPTTFMEYCYNKSFPVYLRKLCDLAILAKKRWRDGGMMAAIDIMVADILKNLPKYLRVFDDNDLSCIEHYDQSVYHTGYLGFVVSSMMNSSDMIDKPMEYLACVKTHIDDDPIQYNNFVIYHNGDILFNQLSVPFGTKVGEINQFDRLLDINDALVKYLIPSGKLLRNIYGEKFTDVWIAEIIDTIKLYMRYFFITKEVFEDGEE